MLFDAQGRILLFVATDRLDPTSERFWYLPGGGMETGERPQDAVRRELREEAGIEDAKLGAVVNRASGITFRFEGRDFEQDEWHVVGWLATGQVGAGQPSDPEAQAIADHRWWSVDDLRTTTERIYPPGLADLAEAAALQSPSETAGRTTDD